MGIAAEQTLQKKSRTNVYEDRAIKAMQTEAPREDNLKEKKEWSISNLWDRIRGLPSVKLELQKGEKSIEEVLKG